MNPRRNALRLLLGGIAACVSVPAFAQQSTADHSVHHPAQAQGAAALTAGEVRKVDVDATKITIRHGPIVNLDMPGMTMVFQVKEPATLGQVKAGDKIKFVAEKIGGQFTVTHIEPAK